MKGAMEKHITVRGISSSCRGKDWSVRTTIKDEEKVRVQTLPTYLRRVLMPQTVFALTGCNQGEGNGGYPCASLLLCRIAEYLSYPLMMGGWNGPLATELFQITHVLQATWDLER